MSAAADCCCVEQGQPVSVAADGDSPALSVRNLSVTLQGYNILKNVTFETGGNTLVGVVGPNGAGKSTLFNVISGLLSPTSGSVSITGDNGKRSLLAYVPQRDTVNWRIPVTAEEVVAMGRVTGKRSWFKRITKQDKERIRDALERVDMWRHRGDTMSELSGGQKQRVFVARALAQQAKVYLLDESFSGVDAGAQEYLVKVLRSLRDDGNIILTATHDLNNLAERFDKVLCLNCHVCAYGPPEEAFTPEVLEELYGSHGVTTMGSGPRHLEHPD